MSLSKITCSAVLLLLMASQASPALADELPAKTEPSTLLLDTAPIERAASQAGNAVSNLLSGALDLIGIRYRRGGT